eukprot:6177122-Pleurochrysis_carterae.AAC.2
MARGARALSVRGRCADLCRTRRARRWCETRRELNSGLGDASQDAFSVESGAATLALKGWRRQLRDGKRKAGLARNVRRRRG